MPFIFCHPAIILPLRFLPKSWFSLTALTIGSLTPDFEYFLRMTVKSNYSHTLYGIFWFDLPLALLLAFVFHNLTRNLLISNLPNFISNRVSVFNDFNWNAYFKKNWLIIIISSLIGIFSHLFWDSFTHQHGYFVNQIDILKYSVVLFEKEIPVWKITQHTSTLIGSVIIVIAFLKLPQNFTFKTSINKPYWTTAFLFTLAILFIRFAIHPNTLNIGNLVVSIIASFMIAITIIPLLIKSKLNTEN